MAQLNEQQINDALKRGITPAQITSFMKTGSATSAELPATANKVVNGDNQGIFGKTANFINSAYEKFKNLPVIKQVSQGIGAVVGAAGAVEGAIAGGVGQVAVNIAKGDNITKDVVKSAVQTGKETAQFGYGLGKEGAPAAALGALGTLPNLAVAYGQGYQGLKDIYEGAQENDIPKQFGGALALGTSLFAGKTAVKEAKLGNILIDPTVVSEIKSLPANMRTKAYESVRAKTVETYADIINQTPKEFRTELKYNKNTPQFLTDEGIILKAEGGKLNNTEAINTLSERAGSLDNKLQETLSQKPAQHDLTLLAEKTKAAIKDDKTILAKDKKDSIQTIDDYVNAEIEANGGNKIVESPQLNQFKRNLWQDSFSRDKSVVVNDTLFKMGHEAKDMIEVAHPESKAINQELGNYVTAMRVLDKAQGRKIKGSFFGKVSDRIIGAIAGGVTGNPLGAIAGAEIAGRMSDTFRSPELRTGIRQKVLGKLKPKEQIAVDKPDLTNNNTVDTIKESNITNQQNRMLKDYQDSKKFTSKKESPLKKKQWAILTAENPNGNPLDAATNAARNEALIQQLKEDGYDVIPVEGHYGGNPKNSFIVPGMKNIDALKYGIKHGQESVLTPKGLIYRDGTVNPADLNKINFDSKQSDFYTKVNINGKEVKFSIPIDFETKKPLIKITKKSSPKDKSETSTTTKEDPLIQEAKKYKSAEEFVKAQGTPVYHASKNIIKEFGDVPNNGTRFYGKGTYFSKSIDRIKEFGDNIIEARLNLKTPYTEGDAYNKPMQDQIIKLFGKKQGQQIIDSRIILDATKVNGEKLAEMYKKAGYDGIIARGGNDIAVFNPKEIVKTKSQLEEIWKKANKNVEIEPLIQEAKKYKSAEEFVKAQGTPVYHGGTEIKEVGNMRSKWGAFYMTDNPTYAKSYGGNKSFLNEMVITPEAKLADLRKPSSDIVKQIEDIISPKKTGKTFKIQKPDGSFIEVPETKGSLSNPVHSSADIIQGIKDGKAYYAEMPEVKEALKKLGYDGMITQESKFGANYGVWNKDVIKTKSQLTDIWNKANKKSKK